MLKKLRAIDSLFYWLFSWVLHVFGRVAFCSPGIAGSLRPHPPIHEDDQRSGSGCILAVFLDQERSIDFQYDRNKITRLDVILLHINIYVKILDPIFEKGVLGPKSHNFRYSTDE